MRKLARILGMLAVVVAFSGCGNKTATTPIAPSVPVKSTPVITETPTTAPAENPVDTSEIPQINSSNPAATDLNNLANDIDSVNQSAQDLDETEDLSIE